MNFEELVGKTFQENQLFETLHFDIKQDFESYSAKFIHIYFDQLGVGQIRVNKVVSFPDEAALNAVSRKIIGTKCWIEIWDHANHIDLMICQKDRSGKFSIVGPSLNLTQAFEERTYGFPDLIRPLTAEEKRQAFAELAGIFEDHLKISKSKISV